MNNIPGFTAEASLHATPSSYRTRRSAPGLANQAQVLPQQSGYECGNLFLNSICPPLLNTAYVLCWYVCLWGRYSDACRACVIAHALPCADCSGI
jgi:hypothetical protein